jgi:hypothetical protein
VNNASVKAKTTRAAKRDLFTELSEGMAALAEARQGKRTLRTHAIGYKHKSTLMAFHANIPLTAYSIEAILTP